MREKTKAARSVLRRAFLCSLVFLPLYIALIVLNGARYHELKQDIENCGNDTFIRYTGQCTDVYYEKGWRLKSSIENSHLNGQGWHLLLDNGRGYYIPKVWEDEMPRCSDESLKALAGKTVTVMCLPERSVPNLNLIVSLEADGAIYVEEADAYAYLVQQKEALRTTIPFVLVMQGIIMLLILPVALIELHFALKKARKKQRKQENMQRLKEADLLHPKNQRRRKERDKT
jgi:uncharacterized membrane protein YozB (DUF420 family)